MSRRTYPWKRAFDVLASGAGLVLLSPIMSVVAIAIKLESRGPVFFRQGRVGRGETVFQIHKFRSMTAEHDGATVSATGDLRVTRVGRFIRRSKLDELPQLLDVLNGNMSIVGPRPELPLYVAQWTQAQRETILSVRPGMTDPASVAFRNEADELALATDPESYYVQVLLPKKAAMYVEYVGSISPVGDLMVILKTFQAILRDR